MSPKKDFWEYDGKWFWEKDGYLFSTPLTQVEKADSILELVTGSELTLKEDLNRVKEFSVNKVLKATESRRKLHALSMNIALFSFFAVILLVLLCIGIVFSGLNIGDLAGISYVTAIISSFVLCSAGALTCSTIEATPSKKYEFHAFSRPVKAIPVKHNIFQYGRFPEYAEDLIKDKAGNKLLNYVGDEIVWVLDWLESDGVKGTIVGEKTKNSFMKILQLGPNAQIRNIAIEWNASETFVVEHIAQRIKTTKHNIENGGIDNSLLEDEPHKLAEPVQLYSPHIEILEDSENDDSITTSIRKPNRSEEEATTPVNLPETSRKIVAKIKSEIGRLRSDIIWVIDNPAFFDDYSFISQDLFEKLAEWDDLEYSTEKPSTTTLSEISNKIQELFEVAKTDAERLGVDYLHGATKSKVMKASKLVHKAQSTDSTAEHDSLMGKAAELLSGIMDTILPKQAAVALEAYNPKQLTNEKVKTASLLKIDEMIEEKVS